MTHSWREAHIEASRKTWKSCCAGCQQRRQQWLGELRAVTRFSTLETNQTAIKRRQDYGAE
jgi:hypothetical protein